MVRIISSLLLLSIIALGLSCSRQKISPSATSYNHGDLVRAAATGDRKRVVELLGQGVDINENVGSIQQSITPLIVSIVRGHSSIASLLLANGASTDPKFDGYSAYDYALRLLGGNSETVRAIEER